MQLFMQTTVYLLDHATGHTNKPRVEAMMSHDTVYVWDGACVHDSLKLSISPTNQTAD